MEGDCVATNQKGVRGMQETTQGFRRGQSTIEYILVAVAVLLAVMYGVKTVLEPKIQSRMDQAGQIIDKAGAALGTATGTAPPSS